MQQLPLNLEPSVPRTPTQNTALRTAEPLHPCTLVFVRHPRARRY